MHFIPKQMMSKQTGISSLIVQVFPLRHVTRQEFLSLKNMYVTSETLPLPSSEEMHFSIANTLLDELWVRTGTFYHHNYLPEEVLLCSPSITVETEARKAPRISPKDAGKWQSLNPGSPIWGPFFRPRKKATETGLSTLCRLYT